MAKIAALVLLALVAFVAAHPHPLGGIGVAHKTAHVSSSVVSPYMGMGMMGYPGLGVGHTVSHHTVSHGVPHLGMGMGMMGMKTMGMGYGLMG